MQFLVRWSGFGEESDSWEPYKTLMHTEPLHRYLRAHKMKSLTTGYLGADFFPVVATGFLVGRAWF